MMPVWEKPLQPFWRKLSGTTLSQRKRLICPPGSAAAMTLPTFEEYIDTGHSFMVDPIGQALRKGVREIGKIMARNGFSSDDAMRVVDLATSNSPKNSTFREIICDKHFDGIQFSNEEWVA